MAVHELDKEYTIFKIRRKFGTVVNAANHFDTVPAAIYLIAAGLRGQTSKRTKSKRIFEQLLSDGLIVFKH